MLVRSDNTTAVAVVNRGGTMQPNLAQLSAAIQEVCRELDIDLAAIHIPGVANKLADALSRFVRRQDHSDWMLHRHIFQALREAVQQHFLPGGQDLTLDACADPVGNNARSSTGSAPWWTQCTSGTLRASTPMPTRTTRR